MSKSSSRKPLTLQRLRDLLHYDPITGLFTWKVNRPAGPNTRYAGDLAGTVNKVSGYVVICIDCVDHYAHRLAHLYMTGAWPDDEIDHKDLNRSNNAWLNLRPATKTQQRFNQRGKPNRSGFKGVVPTAEGRFRASINVNNKHIHIGHFDTAEEAHGAYLAKAADVAGEFARGN